MIRFKTFAISATTLLMAPSALACSCLAFESAEAQLEAADLAFEGQVINVAPERDTRPFWERFFSKPIQKRFVTTFQVYDVLKGEAGSTVTLTHLGAEQSAACGLDFKQTDPFVVLAYRRSDGSYSSSLCTQAQFSTEAFKSVSATTSLK